MGFTIPKMNTVATEITDVSIYLRSVKKWGKSTLFRDVVRAKFNDLTKGVLVECGLENGDTMLDANMVHLDTYKEFVEFKKWLIEEKGKSHDIKMICFDTADELVPIFEAEIIRKHNAENPTKTCKSILAAYGGYNAGRKMAADLIKKYIGEIKKAGFAVWVIAHTKFKTIREKGSTEEEGYMQLTSNLVNDYESAFGDVFDATLTGVIDRVFDEKTDGKTTKKYTTDSVRKLYFRGTTLIDAGGRFASGTVPEYMEYNTDSFTFAKNFIEVVENGLKGSKIDTDNISAPKPQIKKASEVAKPKSEPEIIETLDDDDDIIVEADNSNVPDIEDIRAKFKAADDDTKAEVRNIMKKHGVKKLESLNNEGLLEIASILL